MKFQLGCPSAILSPVRCVSMAFGLLLAGLLSASLLADENARKVVGKSEPQTQYDLKPEHGPWLVFAMSFDGYNAKSQAEQLATELRRDFKLSAYCMAKKLDFTQPIAGAGTDPNGNTRKMKFRERKVIDGYAVLVGDFDSIDSSAIKDTLTKIKRINPKVLANTDSVQEDFSKSNTVPVSSWRDFLKTKYEGTEKLGPMSNAFTTRNPMLPDEYYKTPEVDRFVKKLNEEKAHSEFNLLGCPSKFTVRVAVFSGEDRAVGGWGGANIRANIDEQKVSQLEIAAERAALATRALRRAGYPAYQFHDRTQSIVTIGSFNELGQNDQRNRFVYDPNIQEVVTRFGATSQLTRTTKFGITPTPRLLLELVDQKQIPELNEGTEKSKHLWFAKYSIPFDLKPTPMAVPKSGASSVYSGSLLGKDRH